MQYLDENKNNPKLHPYFDISFQGIINLFWRSIFMVMID